MIDRFEAIVLNHEVDGRYLTVASVRSAAAFLKQGWPAKRGPAHKSALQACLGALTRKERPETAREAFMAALREAGIPLR